MRNTKQSSKKLENANQKINYIQNNMFLKSARLVNKVYDPPLTSNIFLLKFFRLTMLPSDVSFLAIKLLFNQ